MLLAFLITMMEQLLHYCWKHKLFPLEPITTTDGLDVEVIDPGLYNRRDSGPDFFNAKVRINGTLWVGNVEIHQKSSDWYAHGHDRDAAYNNVVLHVCGVVDTDVRTADGKPLPQMVLQVPAAVRWTRTEPLSGNTARRFCCHSAGRAGCGGLFAVPRWCRSG